VPARGTAAYLASTYEDLREFRAEVTKAVRRQGFVIVPEKFADDLARSQEAIRVADAVVCIVP
jgi:hypothetical protein